MKRMIAQSLIAWVKSLFHRVAPGEGEGDIQVGGNLEVGGNVDVGGKNLYVSKIASDSSGFPFSIRLDDQSIVIWGGSPILTVNTNFVRSTYLFIAYGGLKITSGQTLKIGSTTLTEDQLKKLIALIPAE